MRTDDMLLIGDTHRAWKPQGGDDVTNLMRLIRDWPQIEHIAAHLYRKQVEQAVALLALVVEIDAFAKHPAAGVRAREWLETWQVLLGAVTP